MENFVLAEVEYALNNGYSKRAKRHMKRNLYKETKKLRNDIILEMKNMHNESDIKNELSYNDFKTSFLEIFDNKLVVISKYNKLFIIGKFKIEQSQCKKLAFVIFEKFILL